MSWTDEKVEFLKKYWRTCTARELAEKMGPGFTRNSIIGKASRLGLSAKIKARSSLQNHKSNPTSENISANRKGRKSKFRSLLLDKNFEPAKNLSLEELTENTCKYAESDPDKPDFSFCGRKTVDKFSYCPLHLILMFTPKNKKEDMLNKEHDVPKFIEKKIKSA